MSMWDSSDPARYSARPVDLSGGWPEPAPKSLREVKLDESVERFAKHGIERESAWRSDAHCLGESPLLWDLDFYKSPNEAWSAGQVLCADCPVIRECAQSALKPVVDGFEQVGVIRAGVPLGVDGAREELQLLAKGKLTRARIELICSLAAEGLSQERVARQAGVSVSSVWKVLRDRRRASKASSAVVDSA